MAGALYSYEGQEMSIYDNLPILGQGDDVPRLEFKPEDKKEEPIKPFRIMAYYSLAYIPGGWEPNAEDWIGTKDAELHGIKIPGTIISCEVRKKGHGFVWTVITDRNQLYSIDTFTKVCKIYEIIPEDEDGTES